MKKISILFILPDLETGGAERIVMTLANHLPRTLFEPKILLLRKEGGYLDFLKDDVEIIDIRTPRIRYSIPPILQVIRKRKPNIVFCGFGEINAYLSLFTKLFPGTRFIARETNVVSKHVTRPEIRFFYRFYNNFYRIICQSDDMRNDLISNFGIQSGKTVKINNPVDFKFIDTQLEKSRKPDAFTPGMRHVVAIGNLSARKGFDLLLQVFTFLKEDNIMLHILGDGRDRELLKTQAQGLGLDHVIFHGQQKNPYKFLHYADLFALSSRYEGFPNVLLEAGACGVYAVANDCPGGIREIVLPGINGDIISIEDAEDSAKKIRDTLALHHDRNQIRSAIQERFSSDIILKQYTDLLLEAVK